MWADSVSGAPLLPRGLLCSCWCSLTRACSLCCCVLRRERLQVDPREHPMLLAEPSHNTPAIREK